MIWFTGLSGSGKTTIAKTLTERLEAMGKKVKIFDGDVIRATSNKHLGFSPKDIHENNRLIAEMVKKVGKNVDFILIPIISPYQSDRAMARKIIGKDFVEVYVNTPLQECIRRDVKGLYKKALKGEISNFIGLSDENPYEPPESPDIEIDTIDSALDENVQKIIDLLKIKPYEQSIKN